MTAAANLPRSLELQTRAARVIGVARRSGAHAYLLSGPPGAGPMEAAQWLAAGALCPAGGGDGCEVCGRVSRAVHPDLHILRAEGTELAIEQIRELVDRLSRRPFEADRQVAIIEDADTLGSTNAAAGNALLKVLEEPPGDVLFLLLATRVAQVLPTLRSRAVEVPFRALADAVLREELERAGVTDAALASTGLDLTTLARAARGNVALAHELAAGGPASRRRQLVLSVAEGMSAAAAQPSAAADALMAHVAQVRQVAEAAAEQELEAFADRLPPKDASRFRTTRDPDGMEKRIKRRGRRAEAAELRLVLEELATWYRDLLAARAGAAQAIVNADRLAALTRLALAPAAERAVAALDAIDELEGRAAANIDTHVAITALCAELVSLAEGRIRSRRTFGAGSRTAQGYELALG